MTDWSEIVRQHSQLVWRTAYRLLGCSADASDCLQKTFLAAIRVDRRESVRDWPALLHRLATTQALDLLRVRCRQRGRREASADVAELVATDPSPVRRAEAAELAERLRMALSELPERQAEVFCLCCVDGLSYAEAAVRLDIEPGGVGALLHRARKKLRRRLTSLESGLQAERKRES